MSDSNPKTVVVKFIGGDVRECTIEGDEYVHVLNPAYRIKKNDPRIKEVK
jgi:hypothetical protein